MAQAILEENLDECHKVFATEVVRALNKFYLIPVDLAPITNEVEYLTEGIYWGIITVSYLFRDKNRKVFKLLRKGLKNENYFYESSMYIPTERNDKFFFNFLRRVAKIYEMAVFCYNNNNDNYFETARNSLAEFQDKEYFEFCGSWERLDRIGSFLNFWSKRLRHVIIRDMHRSSPVCSSSDEVVETYPEKESKEFEDPKSSDEDSTEGLTSDISCHIERERENNSALVLLLADEITDDDNELGSIEDEIKAIMRFITKFLHHRVKIYYKGLSEASKNQNISTAETPNVEKSNTKSETATMKIETENTKNESPITKNNTASLLYEKIAEEMASNLTEKISIKAKCEELVKVLDETKACFQENLDSNKSKLISHPVTSKKDGNKIGYSAILEEDLYLSSSSNDENIERPSANKDCNKNKIPTGGDLHKISDETTPEFSSDQAVPEKNAANSPDDTDYIKFLEYDLFVKAETFRYTSFSHSNSDSDNTEPYSGINSLADEGDSCAAHTFPSSENNESSSENIKSENKAEAKNDILSLDIPTASSAAALTAAEEDSDESIDSNNEEQRTPTKSKSNSTEAAGKPNISDTNDAKTQQRKTKRRKKKGKSKK